MIEILQLEFFRNAIFVSILASISCGFIGTYIVTRRLVFFSGGITHASFGGIGIGHFLGINPLLGASVFSVLSALAMNIANTKLKVREDSAIGILWSLGVAIGVIFIYLTPGYAPNLMTYLFGSILTVTRTDLMILSILVLVTIIFFALMYRNILYVSFDEDYAKSQGVRVNIINYILITITALVVVFNIRIAGIILVISFLTIPANIANIFTHNYKTIIFLSVLIGFVGSCFGLFLSFLWNIPSGATIIFVLITFFIISKTAKFLLIKFNANKSKLLR